MTRILTPTDRNREHAERQARHVRHRRQIHNDGPPSLIRRAVQGVLKRMRVPFVDPTSKHQRVGPGR